MTKLASNPATIARAAMQRGVGLASVLPLGLGMDLQLAAGAGGITRLMDEKTGQCLGVCLDATVLERTRIFLR